ncbi:hypothetical protein ACQP1O_17210 [Nocardia sp. CA-151230]
MTTTVEITPPLGTVVHERNSPQTLSPQANAELVYTAVVTGM